MVAWLLSELPRATTAMMFSAAICWGPRERMLFLYVFVIGELSDAWDGEVMVGS